MKIKRVAFLSGTRADYVKIKSLVAELSKSQKFDVEIYATGIHLLKEYGYTVQQIERDELCEIVKFENQKLDEPMELVLSRTISKLSEVLEKRNPDLLVIHGDRVEALAGAICGALRNIRVAHIEGGEISGTVDNLIRHSVSKLSQHHFVANIDAKNILNALGESDSQIHVIGSPDIDVMDSPDLPSISEVFEHYGIDFSKYGILLFHPVTTEIDSLSDQAKNVCRAVERSGLNWVVIQPNNDHGSRQIRNELEKLGVTSKYKHVKSMRFEYFLSLLRNSELILGNSSAGIREAPHYGIPTVNVGTRQRNRTSSTAGLSIHNCSTDTEDILNTILAVSGKKWAPVSNFGDGGSSLKFLEVLLSETFWSYSIEKPDMFLN